MAHLLRWVAALLAMGVGAVTPAHAQSFTDLWWNPSEPGWGLLVDHRGSTMAATLLVYRDDGKATWFLLEENDFDEQSNMFTTHVLKNRAVPGANGSLDPLQVELTTHGKAAIDFAPSDLPVGSARLTYTIDATTVTRVLQRQPYGSAAPDPTRDYTGTWRDAADTRTFLWTDVVQHGNQAVVIVRTYDDDGEPTFYVVPGFTFATTDRWSGSAFTTSGAPFSSASYDPARLDTRNSGQLSFSFTRAADGSPLTLAAEGSLAARSVLRTLQPASAPPPGLLGNAPQVCVGTFEYLPLVRCRGAPGNTVYASFGYKASIRIEGTFTPSPRVPSIYGRVTLGTPLALSFSYEGNGVCKDNPTVTSASIAMWNRGVRLAQINLGTFRKVSGDLYNSDDGKTWEMIGHDFFAQCTMQ